LEEVEGTPRDESANATDDSDILFRSTAWKRICNDDIMMVKNVGVCSALLTDADTYAKYLYYTGEGQNIIDDTDVQGEYNGSWFNCSGERVDFASPPAYYCQKVQEPCSALSTLPETIETIGSSFGTVTLILVPAYLLFSTFVWFCFPKSRKQSPNDYQLFKPQSPNDQPVKPQSPNDKNP